MCCDSTSIIRTKSIDKKCLMSFLQVVAKTARVKWDKASVKIKNFNASVIKWAYYVVVFVVASTTSGDQPQGQL